MKGKRSQNEDAWKAKHQDRGIIAKMNTDDNPQIRTVLGFV